ncbi:vWA domain-containing protein [Kitasatospora sp. NPDC048365]|uniref:vWA domain-containing protein n=1 Tax=Kitasatospora sp. NPDC048365 TaxID=3364050 RepID=UPI0037143B11
MSNPLLSAATHRLHPVVEGGPITGQQAGVGAADLPAGTPAAGLPVLLTLESGGSGVTAELRLVPLAEVPAGVVALGEERAAALGLEASPVGQTWRIDRPPVVPLRRIRLEMPTESPLDAAVRELADAGLAGRLLWLPAEPDHELWLEVSGLPYRVQLADADGQRGVLGEITAQTEVELFASGARNGVDIVVLADCSGSMSVDDIPGLREEGGGGFLSVFRRPAAAPRQQRMEALRSALQYLLEMRLQLSGRVSRIALVQFTHSTHQVFPRGGGMAELDAGSAGTTAAEFRQAVALLRPVNAGTDIGNALHDAANLLYHHGKPGNEKLVVLVSDGAHWAPKGDQGLGEVVRAAEEPVSLMEHLHRDMGVRLHAIGISTPAMYQQWVRDGNQGGTALEPNHQLLGQLVRVGGGETAAIGGFDVLAHAFSGLGSGTTRRVPLRGAADTAGRPLHPRTAAALRALGEQAAGGGQRPAPGPDTTGLAERLSTAATRVITESQRVFGRPLLDARNVKRAVTRSVVGGDSEDGRRFFVRDLTAAFRPARTETVLPVLGPPLDALHRFLDAAAQGVEAESAAWRAARVEELTGLLEQVAAVLAAAHELPPVPAVPPRPPAVPPAVPPQAPAAAPAQPVDRAPADLLPTGHPSTGNPPPEQVPSGVGAEATYVGPPPAAAPTGSFAFRYRGEE